MDTKRLIIGMALAMAVVWGYYLAMAWLAEIYGWELGSRPAEPPAVVEEAPPAPAPPITTDPVTDPTDPVDPAAPPPVAPPAPPPPAPGVAALRIVEPAENRPVSIGSERIEDPEFRMGIALTTRGAGISQVLLNEFRAAVDAEDRYVYQAPYDEAPDRSRPLATRSVTVNGQSIDLSGVDWQLESATVDTAVFYIDLADDAGPVVRVRKHFEMFRPPGAVESLDEPDPGLGYEIVVRKTFQNLSQRQLQVRTAFNGPTMPPQEVQYDDRQVIAGHTQDRYIRVAHFMIAQLGTAEPARELLRTDEGHPMVWAGTSSVYFNAIVRPLPLREGLRAPDHFTSVRAEALNPDSGPLERRVAMIFETADLVIEAGGELEVPLRVFFGPKKRPIFQTAYYSSFPLNYNRTLGTTMAACAAWCTFNWLIEVLVAMLRFFHMMFRDWGLAIIGLVVVVRLLLHPITRKSTVSMYKMGKLAPEMERLKKKYGDNKEELNKAMMQFYREQGFSPMLGCLPMFLQMPIWIALWQSLQQTFELRHAPFLEFFGVNFTWINDLSRPDRLISWEPIPLFFGIHLESLNLLPLLLAVVFYLQYKFTPKPAATTPEQAQQQKMMQYMTLLFPIFLYAMPSGLNLYILTSTTIGIFESRHIRNKIRAREEAEKAEKVIVEAGPTRGSKRKPKPPEEPPKRGGIMGWIADLQEKAEDVRRQNNRPRGGR